MPKTAPRNTVQRGRAVLLSPVILAIGAAGGTTFMVSDFRLSQLALALTYGIAVTGLNLLIGFSGQISVGHGAFFALGGYLTALAQDAALVPYPMTLGIVAFLSFGSGLAFGLPSLRLRGLYLALATLALAVLVPQLVKRSEALGGVDGLSFSTPSAPAGLPLTEDQYMFLVVALVTVAMLVGARNLVEGRIGRALVAVRENEPLGTAMGVNVSKVKALAFAYSAMYAGIAGGLYALLLGFVAPDSFTLLLSFLLLTGVVVGGLGTIGGGIVGGLFIQFVPFYATNLSTTAPAIIFGVAMIAVVYTMPGGIYGTGKTVGTALKGLLTKSPDGSSDTAAGVASAERLPRPGKLRKGEQK